MQFTTQEHEQGLAYLSGHVKPDEIQNANLLRVLKNRGTQQLFIGEASQDHEISVKQITQVKQALERHNQKKDNYRHESMADYRAVNYRETKPRDYLGRLLTDTLMYLLYDDQQEQMQTQKRQVDLAYELERKQRQHHKKGRHYGILHR